MPARLITLKHSGLCRKCRNPIPAGERAYWQKGMGVWHTGNCQSDTRESAAQSAAQSSGISIPKTETVGDYFTGTVTWFRLKEIWLASVNNGPSSVFKIPQNAANVAHDISGYRTSQRFYGATETQMREWLRNGYRVPGLKTEPGLAPERQRRKIVFSDEGELQIDLALSGFDYPFTQWTPRERRPGLKMNIDMSFMAAVPQETIRDYSVWIAQAIYTLEMAGYDLEINLRIPWSSHMWADSGSRGSSRGGEILVTVKRENEATDFGNYSPLFSPGGYRILGFLAYNVAGEIAGKPVVNSYRAYSNNRWSCILDSETRKMEIKASYGGTGGFPEAAMTEAFKTAMKW